MRGPYPFEADEATLARFARVWIAEPIVAERFASAASRAMRAAPDRFAPAPSTRVALIRSLLQHWERADRTDPASRTELTRIERQAFLLAAIEGLTDSAVASALGSSEATAAEWIRAGASEIAAQMKATILLLAGEAPSTSWLLALIEAMGHRPLGPARTLAEALGWLEQEKPRLILADLRLDDAGPLPVLINQLLDRRAIPVVLIGSDPAHGDIGSFRSEVFRIADPLETDLVKAVLMVALFFHHEPSNPNEAVATDTGLTP